MSVVWKVDRSLIREPFATDVDQLLAADLGAWVITEGFRSEAYQAALFDKYKHGGALAAPPGRSAHEKGLAVDVTLVQNGHDDWNYHDVAWRRLVQKVHMHPRLHSLDDIGDTDHIEAVNWRIIAATPQKLAA